MIKSKLLTNFKNQIFSAKQIAEKAIDLKSFEVAEIRQDIEYAIESLDETYTTLSSQKIDLSSVIEEYLEVRGSLKAILSSIVLGI